MMSVVHLHIGQCGLQIGEDYWLKALKRYQVDNDNGHVLLQMDRNPRALFIDSEKKVIRHFSRRIKASKLPIKFNVLENSIQSRTGCGSNWALGHNKLPGAKIMGDVPNLKTGFGQVYLDPDSTMLQTCLDSIRLKIEKSETFSGFLGFQSLAGGTGSGFGSRLCEELRDIYPTAYRLWNVVTPFSVGESPTQNYNQLLSMTSLYQNSDAIMLLENDAVLEMLSAKQSGSVSMKDINSHMADAMLGLFAPTDSLTPSSGGVSIGMEPWELCRSVAPMPSLKLLKSRHVSEPSPPSQANVWTKMTRSFVGQVKQASINGKTISSLIVARGQDYLSVDWKQKLKGQVKFVSWNPFPVDIWEDNKSKKRSLTYCSNLTSSGTQYCSKVLEKSKIMFKSGAYLHWYERYGTNKEVFSESFDVMQQVVDSYKEAES
uniref:Tubulin delta chain n=1 Tax=Phallusia mammillata TaxID=59560 RepID=A0A6F9DW20_9ASCI|nr:tubulin delta chain [Phallusia mammillata]